jgi:Tfp pilus assembly protein PilO
MIHWWNEAPIWQRFLIFGMAVGLFGLGMQTWVWSSQDNSIVLLTRDIADLTTKNQEAIKTISALKDVEGEVVSLREKLLPTLQQLPIGAEPRRFRRDVVNIGKQTGVSVRLWRPQKNLSNAEQADMSLRIIVKVEGSFHGTVQFLERMLELSWIQAINPVVLMRKPDAGATSQVMTDFTIKGLAPQQLLPTKERLKT